MKDQNKETTTSPKESGATCLMGKKNTPLFFNAVILGSAILITAGVARSNCEIGTKSQTSVHSGGENTLAASDVQPIAWRIDYEAALKEASEKNKPVLLRFTASWCPPCKIMDGSVWLDKKVASAVAANVIPVKIDIDEPATARLSEQFRVQSIPTLIMVDSRGQETARGAFMSINEVLEFMKKGA